MSLIKKLKNKYRYNLLSLFLRLKIFRLKNSILIFSNPRGGSTWVMEIFNSLPYSVTNWEPLHNKFGIVPSAIDLGINPYLPKDYSNSTIKELFYKIVTLRIFNEWTTKNIGLKKLIFAKYVITKFILANQLLPWFVVNFSNRLKYKPVYLVRHPITTCISQLKTFHKLDKKDFFKTLKNSQKFLIPEDVYSVHFKNHVDYINSLESKIEQSIAIWCVNNSNLLVHECSDHWITVFYEDLVKSPLEKTEKMFTEVGLDFNFEKLKEFDFTRPSKSNFDNQFNNDCNIQLESFLNEFSIEQLQRIQNIFDYFNFKIYTAFDAYPIVKNNYYNK